VPVLILSHFLVFPPLRRDCFYYVLTPGALCLLPSEILADEISLLFAFGYAFSCRFGFQCLRWPIPPFLLPKIESPQQGFLAIRKPQTMSAIHTLKRLSPFFKSVFCDRRSCHAPRFPVFLCPNFHRCVLFLPALCFTLIFFTFSDPGVLLHHFCLSKAPFRSH